MKPELPLDQCLHCEVVYSHHTNSFSPFYQETNKKAK